MERLLGCHDTRHKDARHNDVRHNDIQQDFQLMLVYTYHNETQCLCRVSLMLSIAVKSIMLNVVMLNVIMLNVVMLNVVA